MTKILALTTTQGTAIPETALCENHWSKEFRQVRSDAQFIPDWDRLDFVDASGNDQLACQSCGATTYDNNEEGKEEA